MEKLWKTSLNEIIKKKKIGKKNDAPNKKYVTQETI